MNIEIDYAVSKRDADFLHTAATGDLISNWATRVIVLWEHSRRPEATRDESDFAELAGSYRVRDEVNSRLECGVSAVSTCSEQSTRILAAADAMFTRSTVEASTPDGLSAYNHYASQREWWWKRLPRGRSTTYGG